MSLSAESANELTQTLSKPKSTFYLTEVINVDEEEPNDAENKRAQNQTNKSKKSSQIVRPQVPPPPLPPQQSVSDEVGE